MKMIRKLTTVLLLLSVLFPGCAKKKEASGERVFKIQKHGVMFDYPLSFKKVSGKGLWHVYIWEDSSAEMTIMFKVTWNRDLNFFPIERALDVFVSRYRANNKNSSMHLEEKAAKFPMPIVNSDKTVPALSFDAADEDVFIKGIYVVANNREYILTLKVPVDKKADPGFNAAWNALKLFKLKLLPDHNQYMRKILKDQELKSVTSIREILDYGQQLKSGKADYIRNYPKAINEFRKALYIMQNLTEKPNENRALRLISIVKTLQKKAFDKHYVIFQKAISLKDWKTAQKEALNMFTLMSDDPESPDSKYAKKALKIVKRKLKS